MWTACTRCAINPAYYARWLVPWLQLTVCLRNVQTYCPSGCPIDCPSVAPVLLTHVSPLKQLPAVYAQPKEVTSVHAQPKEVTSVHAVRMSPWRHGHLEESKLACNHYFEHIHTSYHFHIVTTLNTFTLDITCITFLFFFMNSTHGRSELSGALCILVLKIITAYTPFWESNPCCGSKSVTLD